MSYTTKTDIELWFNNAITLDQTYADMIIADSESYIDAIAGRTFNQITVTDEYMSLDNDTSLIYVPNIPLISVQSIEINTGSEFNPVYESVNFVIVDKNKGLIKLETPAFKGANSIKISYTYGYDTVPSHIKKLATDLCVMNVIKTTLLNKSYNDEGDIDLGSIKVTGSFRYSLDMLRSLRNEITELEDKLIGSNGGIIE